MATITSQGSFAYLRKRFSTALIIARVPHGVTQPCLPRHGHMRRPLSTHDAPTNISDENISRAADIDLNPKSQPSSRNPSRPISKGASHAPHDETLAHPADAILNSLPVSPLVDDSFMKARSRWAQPKPKRAPFKPNSFRRKIAANPFAQILATPDRFCPVTRVHIPRGCLQSFKLVSHPSTGVPWWVPSDLLPTTPSAAPSVPDGEAQPTVSTPLDQGPTSYTLPRVDLMRAFLSRSGKYRNGHKTFLRQSNKAGLQVLLNSAIWREDMDVHILDLMRRFVYKQLVYLARLSESDSRHYLVPLTDSAELSKLYQKGCVLYLPGDAGPDTPGQEWSQLDLPVYSLQHMLGPVLSGKLRSELSVFQTTSTTLLRGLRTVDLQKRLWKLHSYNA